MDASFFATAVLDGLQIGGTIVGVALTCVLSWQFGCYLGRPIAALVLTEKTHEFPPGLTTEERARNLFRIQRIMGGCVAVMVFVATVMYEATMLELEAQSRGGVVEWTKETFGRWALKALVEAMVALVVLCGTVKVVRLGG